MEINAFHSWVRVITETLEGISIRLVHKRGKNKIQEMEKVRTIEQTKGIECPDYWKTCGAAVIRHYQEKQFNRRSDYIGAICSSEEYLECPQYLIGHPSEEANAKKEVKKEVGEEWRKMRLPEKPHNFSKDSMIWPATLISVAITIGG